MSFSPLLFVRCSLYDLCNLFANKNNFNLLLVRWFYQKFVSAPMKQNIIYTIQNSWKNKNKNKNKNRKKPIKPREWYIDIWQNSYKVLKQWSQNDDDWHLIIVRIRIFYITIAAIHIGSSSLRSLCCKTQVLPQLQACCCSFRKLWYFLM